MVYIKSPRKTVRGKDQGQRPGEHEHVIKEKKIRRQKNGKFKENRETRCHGNKGRIELSKRGLLTVSDARESNRI